MTTLQEEYFEWLYNLVCGERYASEISYRKLLAYLHHTEFTWLFPNDQNRAEDGINLRYRFTEELPGSCSVLEMMIGLAIRCEEWIMDNPNYGNRTRQWFWSMISSLGLGSMHDERFDEAYVKQIVIRFLNREYQPDGRGGLFTIRNCEYDLRDVEIWYQLCWYLDDIAQ
nr:MAG TPA: hypothetical protein [Caudoviricetes sp.]